MQTSSQIARRGSFVPVVPRRVSFLGSSSDFKLVIESRVSKNMLFGDKSPTHDSGWNKENTRVFARRVHSGQVGTRGHTASKHILHVSRLDQDVTLTSCAMTPANVSPSFSNGASVTRKASHVEQTDDDLYHLDYHLYPNLPFCCLLYTSPSPRD